MSMFHRALVSTITALILVVAPDAATAQSSERTLVFYAGQERYAAHEHPAVLGVTHALSGPAVTATLGANASCWPGDPACAVGLMRAHRATRMILVRILAEHRGCAPIIRAGQVVGSTYLVGPHLSLEIIDASGRQTTRVSTNLTDDVAQTRGTAETLARALLTSTPQSALTE